MSLLQHPSAGWAADTTQQGVTTSTFGAIGKMADSNNESASDVYDVRRFGVGVAAVLRYPRGSRGTPAPSAPPLSLRHEPGGFLLAGLAEEGEWTRQTYCGFGCDSFGGRQGPVSGSLEPASKFGWRAGLGYSFSLVELRVGALQVLPSATSRFPESFWSPDVLVRVGPRGRGWGELGFGAYDASTTLRPGLYVGGGGGNVETVRVSGHLGVHVVNGLCCSSLMPFGLTGSVDAERAVGSAVTAGLELKAHMAQEQVVEAGLHLSFLL